MTPRELDQDQVLAQTNVRVTIVTVCYNDLVQLKKTVKSVRSQTCRSYQHVVIDGNSNDGTQDFLAELSRVYPIEWISEKDDGIFDAMNKGASRATGELVVFLNAGDTFTETDDLEHVIQSYDAEGWSWSYGALRYVDLDGKPIDGAIQAPFQKRRLELGFRFVPHQAMYMRTNFFHELGGFDLEFPLDSDQEISMRAAALAAPHVLIRFLCDFLVGGAHEDASRLQREISYHRMRVKNGLTVGGSRVADLAFSYVVAGQRLLRDQLRTHVKLR